MLQCMRKYPIWVIVIGFVLLLGAGYGIGWLVAWGSAGDTEAAVTLVSTGLALIGAVLGGVGASMPVLSPGKSERRSGVESENKAAARDVWSTFGWALVILGAAASFSFQLTVAIQTGMKLLQFA